MSTDFIGAGERTAAHFLKHLFPNFEVQTQVQLAHLYWLKYHSIADLSSRQKKETIDLMLYYQGRYFVAIRLHGKKGSGKLRAERHQREILEDLGILVVDIHRKDCPHLFREERNLMALYEFISWMVDQGVKEEVFTT